MATPNAQSDTSPVVLAILTGIAADPRHWLNIWARESDDIVSISADYGEVPNRNNWVNNLNLAIQRISRPVILVAEGLGCHVAAWWAELERPAYRTPVIGSLLVSPVDRDTYAADHENAGLVPGPIGILPFPSIMVRGREIDTASLARTKRLSSFWGSQLIESDFFEGAWEEGKALLGRLGRKGTGDDAGDAEALKVAGYRAALASYPM